MRFIRLLNQLRDNLTKSNQRGHSDDAGLDGGGRLDGLGFTDAVTTRFGGRRTLSWASAEEAKQAINELVASGRDRMLL